MARMLFALILGGTIAALLGNGFYRSLRSGVVSNMYGTSRRTHEPISYWVGVFVLGFAFVVLASGTVLLAYVLVHEQVWPNKPLWGS